MANTTIALKKSGTASSVPSNLANGELAINYADGVLFYKHANGTIASITGGGGPGGNYFGTVNAAGTLLVADTTGDVLDIRAGDNIIITGDAVNDRLSINADLTAANSWANSLSTIDRAIANTAANSANAYAITIAGVLANVKLANVAVGGPLTATFSTTAGNTTATLNVATSGVTACTYGSATVVPVITVDSYGRITSAANVTITSSGGASVNVGSATPTSPTQGNLWWNSDLGKLFIYYTDTDSSQWVDVTYSGGGSGFLQNSTITIAGTVTTTGSVNDSKGDVRDLPVNNKAAPYALSLSDTGKLISTTTTILVPNAVFSAGHTVSVFNNSSATININANASVNFILAGQSNSANKLLAQNGIATIVCVYANTFVLSGVGLT